MKKTVTKVLFAVALATGIGSTVSSTVAPTQNVQAVSKHSYHWHRVKTVKNVNVYKLRFPLYKAPKFDFILLKGSRCDIRYFENSNYYEIRAQGVGKNRIVKGSSTSWFKNTK